MNKWAVNGFGSSVLEVMPDGAPVRSRLEPVIVPVLDPVMVPVRDPVMVPVLLVREPVIVPPKVTTETVRVSIIVSRSCPERFMTFLLVNKAFAGNAAGWGLVLRRLTLHPAAATISWSVLTSIQQLCQSRPPVTTEHKYLTDNDLTRNMKWLRLS